MEAHVPIITSVTRSRLVNLRDNGSFEQLQQANKRVRLTTLPVRVQRVADPYPSLRDAHTNLVETQQRDKLQKHLAAYKTVHALKSKVQAAKSKRQGIHDVDVVLLKREKVGLRAT